MAQVVDKYPVVWLQANGQQYQVMVFLETEGPMAGQYFGTAIGPEVLTTDIHMFRADDALRSTIYKTLRALGVTSNPAEEVKYSLEFAAKHGVPQTNR